MDGVLTVMGTTGSSPYQNLWVMTLDTETREELTFMTINEDYGQTFKDTGAVAHWSDQFDDEYIVISFTREKQMVNMRINLDTS